MDQNLLKKEWFVLEKLYSYAPYALEPPVWAMTHQMSEFGCGDVLYSFHEYNNGYTKMCFLSEEWDNAAEKTLKKISEDPSVLDKIHQESEDKVKAIKEWYEKITNLNLQNYSDEELTKTYKILMPLQRRLHFLRCPVWQMETRREIFSNYLLDLLKNIIEEKKLDLDPILVFSSLVTPTKMTLANYEHLDLLKLAGKIQSGELEFSPDLIEIENHIKKYQYLTFGAEGPAWGRDYVLAHLQDLLNKYKEIDKEIDKYENQFEFVRLEQQEIFKKIPLNKNQIHLFEVAKEAMYQRGWSKEHQFMVFYLIYLILKEIARRLNISTKQAMYMLSHEIISALKLKEIDNDNLNDRFKFGLMIIEGKDSYFLTGKKAKEFMFAVNLKEENKINLENITEIKGQTAVKGNVRGKVKIINNVAEMNKMEAGDILVSEMTIPEIVPAMKKAAAIIADRGGITCHAAIVSRELGIPCIISTKIATQVFKDGDMVEVNTDNGIVKKL